LAAHTQVQYTHNQAPGISWYQFALPSLPYTAMSTVMQLMHLQSLRDYAVTALHRNAGHRATLQSDFDRHNANMQSDFDRHMEFMIDHSTKLSQWSIELDNMITILRRELHDKASADAPRKKNKTKKQSTKKEPTAKYSRSQLRRWRRAARFDGYDA
jgi:hypothetical protein